MTFFFDNEDSSVDRFESRHIGPTLLQVTSMLKSLKENDISELIKKVIPKSIYAHEKILPDICPPTTESAALEELKQIMSKNELFQCHIGMGYYPSHLPPVIQRTILENPSWYTQYTPYQAEISQGRLEALFNFQTMITELTGLPIANASLLDEGTAVAEAITMITGNTKQSSPQVCLADHLHPQSLAVIQTRLSALGVPYQIIAPSADCDFSNTTALVLQYPETNGNINPQLEEIIQKAQQQSCEIIVATDLMSLTLLKSPGAMGASVAVGSTQRFGIPLGFGGPHAAFIAAKDEFTRKIPGRMVGQSQDKHGRKAYRLALQTREQHIRREKATSNICTAQVLLAIMSSMYCIYHGPTGLIKIAKRIHHFTQHLAQSFLELGYQLASHHFFDTLTVILQPHLKNKIKDRAAAERINFRQDYSDAIGISLDETTTKAQVDRIIKIFADLANKDVSKTRLSQTAQIIGLPKQLIRTTSFLSQEIFNTCHSETKLLRYIKNLETKDISLTHSMIPLGSCTMKLNAASELLPVSWPQVNQIHPFVPENQALGYKNLFDQLESWLGILTGFDGVSLQPNSGAQGEYAGLLVIQKYHQSRGEGHRHICLIPSSAHGTNPASAAMAGMKIIVVKCNTQGNIDLKDLQQKVSQHSQHLAAIMITYPSTHGVFEESIVDICKIVHENGGQVYLDGANLNAQIGLCYPGEYGADICHLNLHKTFCIPHGGGGPGMGPIAAKKHLTPFFPSHPLVKMGGTDSIGTVSAAPWGSPSILPISWMYIRMMGVEGLKKASMIAILNANYIANALDKDFSVVYKGQKGFVAHECIIDLQKVKKSCGIDVEDIAKRLIDYGFHAPTVSWPVPQSMMIEPTESEDLEEINRFCQSMASIRKEIQQIESGQWDRSNNPLKNAPHTAEDLSKVWDRPYSIQDAFFPLDWVKDNKFWPQINRVDNTFGDRHFVCSCPPISNYEEH